MALKYQLVPHQPQLNSPLHEKALTKNEQLREILDDQTLTLDQKITSYLDALKDFLLFNEKAKGEHPTVRIASQPTSSTPSTPQLKQPLTTPPATVDDIVQRLGGTKAAKNKGRQIVSHIVALPEQQIHIKGDMSIARAGQLVARSNIVDIVHYLVNPNQKRIPPGFEEVFTTLRQTNLPRSTVVNKFIHWGDTSHSSTSSSSDDLYASAPDQHDQQGAGLKRTRVKRRSRGPAKAETRKKQIAKARRWITLS